VLKQLWRAQGVQIVRSEKAQYMVIPDGAAFNTRSTDATPIFYSDFVNSLLHHRRPPEPQSTVPYSQNVSKDTAIYNPFDHVESWIQKEPMDNSGEEWIETETNEKETDLLSSEKPEFIWNPAILSETDQIQMMNRLMEAHHFIQETTDTSRTFYPELFDSKTKLLRQLEDQVNVLMTHWSNIRANASVILSLPPTTPTVSDDNPCQEHGKTREKINMEYERLLHQPDILVDVDDTLKPLLATYVSNKEGELQRIRSSILCGLRVWMDRFVQWVTRTRQDFYEFRIGSGKGDCKNSLRMFVHQSCRDKPLLFIWEDLISAFCHTNIPLTEQDDQSILALWVMLADIYKSWFGDLPSTFEPTIPLACSQLQHMSHTIMRKLKTELGLSGDQSLLWSHIPELLQLDTVEWGNLWSSDASKRQPILDYLRTFFQGDTYQRYLSDFVSRLSAMRL